MKCQQCSTEAPAETDPQSGRLRCSKCKALWGIGTSQSAAVRQARDILQKWSSEDMLDQISQFPTVPPLPESPSSTSEEPEKRLADNIGVQNSGAAPESGTSSKILSLAEALQQQRNEDDDDASASDIAAHEPQVSVLDQSSTSVPVEDTRDELTEPEPAVVAMSSVVKETEPKKKKKGVRRQIHRRPPARTTKSDSSSCPPSERGHNVVAKKYRVDQPGGAPSSTASESDVDVQDPRAQDATSARRFRVDRAEPTSELTDGHGRIRGQGPARQRYIDEAHETLGMRGPHFEVAPPPRSSLTSLTGQFLAYVGVLGLTVGTAIVIYGHFGGMSEYTPTGWLVTTVAQMLLFLGVINLVSGGIEQNNRDVSHRINVLGEQLMRIEQVAETAIRGPRIPVEYYAGETSDAESSRETVTTDER